MGKERNPDSWQTTVVTFVASLAPVALFLVAMGRMDSPNGMLEGTLYLIPAYALCGALWWALMVPTLRDEVRVWVGDPVDGGGRPRLWPRALANLAVGGALIGAGGFFGLDGLYLWTAYLQALVGFALIVIDIARE